MSVQTGGAQQRVRVVHISQPTSAGVANVALGLMEDEVGRGWEVHLVCPPDGPLAEAAAGIGARVHAWTATRSPGASVPSETRRLAACVRAIAPDVVLLHSSKAGLAGRLALRGSLPTAFMPHSWSFEAVDGLIGRASLLWERLAARWTHLTICVSEDELAVGRRKHCLAAGSVVVPNGVDLDRWRPRDRAAARAALGVGDGPLAVCVGRLARQKGQDVLLRAWPQVREAVPSARLALVGDGPMGNELRALADESVSMVGAADPVEWFAAADVVVLPSRWEGMPLVALEAMASGRSVVGTDVSGMREALGSDGPVVPVESVGDLARAVRERLGPGLMAQDEGRRNRVRAEECFSVDRAAESIAAQLHMLAGPSTA